MGTQGASGQSGGTFGAFIPLILMFVIFYFLLIRPQQKKQKERKEMNNNLKKGDRIITAGGVHGTITGLTDSIITVEVADKLRLKISRESVAAAETSSSQVKKV